MDHYTPIYDLTVLNKNTNNIKYNNNDTVFVCLFQIVNNSLTNIVYKPYLSYLLYKYPSTSKNEDLIFPFKFIKNNKNPFHIAENLVKNIIDGPITFKGNLSFSNSHYFFYQLNKPDTPIQLVKRDKQLWWAVIDEICNKRKVLNFHVASSCSKLFYKFPQLIYIKNPKYEIIEIPTVTFYGGPAELIPYAASVGIRANASTTYGSFYYAKSFEGAMQNALFTSNYRERNIFRKVISNKNGKYFQGSIIRMVTFLANKKQILYRKTDPFFYFINDYDNYQHELSNQKLRDKTKQLKGKWSQKYDSLMLSTIKLKNLSGYFNHLPYYVIKSQRQFSTLSYHLMDMKFTPPTWNPYYKNYKIK
jgi:hypothetical protein